MLTQPTPPASPTPIHARIDRIRRGEDAQLLAALPSGYAILANQQPDALPGCCMLLANLPRGGTPAHLQDLAPDEQALFLQDAAALAAAVRTATACDRVNILVLCNAVPALHANIIPRYASEAEDKRTQDPFAAYDFHTARRADPAGQDAALTDNLRRALAAQRTGPART